MLAKKTSKNQITLPKAIANAFPDTQYFDVGIQDGKIGQKVKTKYDII